MPELAVAPHPPVSGQYFKLDRWKWEAFIDTFDNTWQDCHLPKRQFDECVRQELDDYRRGKPHVGFDALKRILAHVQHLNSKDTSLLDIGASSAYYSEVLRLLNFKCNYTAVDFSYYFKDLAAEIYPGTPFEIGSATELPFEDKSFDIVLHSACIMTVIDWKKAIAEAARVARKYVIFHRTPVYFDTTETELWYKQAYEVPTLEWKFSQAEVISEFESAGMRRIAATSVFCDGDFGHSSYLLQLS